MVDIEKGPNLDGVLGAQCGVWPFISLLDPLPADERVGLNGRLQFFANNFRGNE